MPRWSGEVGAARGRRRRRRASSPWPTPTTSPIRARRAPAAARAAAQRLTTAARGAYLALPPEFARPAAGAGRRRSTPGLRQRQDRRGHPLAARRHSYTLQPRRPRPASIRSRTSCSTQHAGHCEFFASAAVLLLRAARRPRPLRDRLPGRRMERPRRLRRRPRRPRARLGRGVPPGRGWMRVDATPPARGRWPRAGPPEVIGRARLLLEPLGRRIRPRPPARSRAPRGPRLAPRPRGAGGRVVAIASAGGAAAGGAAARRPPLAPPARARPARDARDVDARPDLDGAAPAAPSIACTGARWGGWPGPAAARRPTRRPRVRRARAGRGLAPDATTSTS